MEQTRFIRRATRNLLIQASVLLVAFAWGDILSNQILTLLLRERSSTGTAVAQECL